MFAVVIVPSLSPPKAGPNFAGFALDGRQYKGGHQVQVKGELIWCDAAEDAAAPIWAE